MTKIKKRVMRIAAVFFTVLALCTFASRSIYNASLPIVTVQTPQRAALQYCAEAIGVAEFLDVHTIASGGAWQIAEVLCAAGDIVQPDTVLFRVNMDTYRLESLQIARSLAAVDAAIAALKPKEQDSAYARDLGYERKFLLLQQEMLERSYPPGGAICAGIAGRIDDVTATVGRAYYAGDALAAILPKGSKPTITWYLAPDTAQNFDRAAEVHFSYLQTGTAAEQQLTLPVAEKTWDSERQAYRFRAVCDVADTALHGLSLPLTITQRTDVFACTVPISALFGTETEPYVYVVEPREGLFGEERCVRRVDVTVAARNETTAAVASLWLDAAAVVVVGCAEEPVDGEAVVVREDM